MSQMIKTKEETHNELIRWLLKYLRERGCDKFYVDHLEGYPKPAQMGRHTPDISAYSRGEKAAVGEAKVGDDLYSERTKEQLKDFSSNLSIDFYFVVPDEIVSEAKKLARELGIYPRSNVIIL